MKYILIIISTFIILVMVWCTSDVVTDNTQTINFLNYTMNISTWYKISDKNNIIDERIVRKIIAVYYHENNTTSFAENIVISQDSLTPRASLEDYVQAAIGWISYTRWKYQSINFQKWSLNCSNIEIPTIMNTFSIYRVPVNSSPETIYFIQYFIHNVDDIIVVSASTSNEENLETIKNNIKTLSCSSL